MESKTDTAFWQMHDHAFKLCERHALKASNAAFQSLGMAEAENMSDVAHTMTMICTISGCSDHPGHEFIEPSETGPCADCMAELEREQ